MRRSAINYERLGLQKGDLECIVAALQKEVVITEAVIFGSRAKGNFKNGSDIDIALKGECITHSIINSLSDYLNEETIMPYRFDILNYHTICNNELTAHIDRVGITIYRKAE